MRKITAALAAAVLGAVTMTPATADGIPEFKNNRDMVGYFWNQVFNRHDPSVIDQMTG